MSPEPAAVSDAPLRFDRPVVSDDPEARRDVEPPAVEHEEAHAPAGPPPLRGPAETAVVTTRAPAEPAAEPVAEPTPSRAERRAAQAAATASAPLDELSRRERKQAVKRRARKVKRIVRRLDAWSVMKVAFIFNLCVYVVTMVAVVLLWNVAAGAGVIDNVESFIEDLGAFETFEFQPDQLLQATALGGAVLAVLATGLIALGAVLFNLISDLVGGIRLTVIEEPGAVPLQKPKSGGNDIGASDTVSEPSSQKASGL